MPSINTDNRAYEEYIHSQSLLELEKKSILLFFLYIFETQEYECTLSDIIYSFTVDFGIIINPSEQIMLDAEKIIEKKSDLDLLIQKYLKNWHIDRISIMTKLILRLGIWQLTESNNPPATIINDSIELSKGYAEEGSFRIVNGILDAYHKAGILREN
jgi:transcription termination factor NusB